MRRGSFAKPAQARGKIFPNTRYHPGNVKRKGQYIPTDKFINQAVSAAAQVEFIPEHQFADFGLTSVLQANVASRGFVTPTPIQDAAIKPGMEGRDVVGLANTGTGKTAAFVLPILHRLATHQSQGNVLIMAPTRELAVQIDDDFRLFARGLGVYSALCVGGVNMQKQINALRRSPQVVVGTPGRLKDLFNQKVLKLDQTYTLVLDEVDRMLDMGFIRDIRFLLEQLPAKRQSLCFSATLTPEIKSLLNGFLSDPVHISVKTTETSDHVEQNVVRAGSKGEKIELLAQMLKESHFDKVLVFGATKWGVQRLADDLSKRGFRAEAIHGNKTQAQRQRALQAFKAGQVEVLVATDVAARGLDIPNVSHVINFDQPTTYADYVHRIGRTGRAGKSGQALTFVGR